MDGFKVCFKCGSRKKISDFYKHPQMADGHLGKCKECTKKDATENRASNIEQRRQYDRDRGKLPERKKQNLKVNREYRKANPKRVIANRAISYAVASGKMKQMPCEVCGSKKSVAHHPDYDYPLTVVWLCQIHHKEAHAKMRQP